MQFARCFHNANSRFPRTTELRPLVTRLRISRRCLLCYLLLPAPVDAWLSAVIAVSESTWSRQRTILRSSKPQTMKSHCDFKSLAGRCWINILPEQPDHIVSHTARHRNHRQYKACAPHNLIATVGSQVPRGANIRDVDVLEVGYRKNGADWEPQSACEKPSIASDCVLGSRHRDLAARDLSIRMVAGSSELIAAE